MRLKGAHYSMWMLLSIAIGIGGWGCKDKKKAGSSKKPAQSIAQKTQPEEAPATPAGQLALAIKYYTGEGRPQDHKKARESAIKHKNARESTRKQGRGRALATRWALW